MTGEQDTLLREILRECERILEYDFRLAEAFDRNAERLIALGVAALGGGVALGLTVLRVVATPPWHLVVLLAIAGILNLWSLLVIATSYGATSRGTTLEIGPDLGWLREKSVDADWELRDHLASLVAHYSRASERNATVLSRLTARRRESLLLLATAALTYGAAYLYLVLGGIET